MTTEQSAFLIEAYDNQFIAVDRLGGTLELTEMTLRFNQTFKTRLTEGQILSWLIGKRKNGELPKKTDRGTKPKAKESWPKAKDGKMRVKVEISLGAQQICEIVSTIVLMGLSLPVTRAEVYDYFVENSARCWDSTWEINHSFAEIMTIKATVQRLFPELT